jgi:predicted dehydrogenase
MVDEVRIGIIGTGSIAGSHIKQYLKTPGVRIVGGADIVPGKAKAFFDRWGVTDAKAYEDYHELLPEVDAVSICTHNLAHYQPTIDTLLAGKHILLEKPMSVSLSESIEMVRTARETGKILSIGFQSRYNPGIIKAREMVQSGLVGKVYYVETGGGRRRGIPGRNFVFKEISGGGAVLDIGCYSIDTAMYVLGNPKPLTVSAYLSNHFGTSPVYSKRAAWGTVDPSKFNVDDFGAAMIRLEGDICLMFKMSWAMHLDTLGPTLWLGTEGGIKLDEGLTLYHDQADLEAATKLTLPSNTDVWMHKIQQFVDAVREGKGAPMPAAEALYGQAIIDGIYRSAASGREVSIEIPSDLLL